MALESIFAIRVTETDLQAARNEAERLGLTLAQVLRIFMAAFARGDLLVTEYIDGSKPVIDMR